MKLRFRHRVPENNPVVIKRTNWQVNNPEFAYVVSKGEHYRVIPETAGEIMYLSSLIKGFDTFAPKDGDGIIVRKLAIDLVG